MRACVLNFAVLTLIASSPLAGGETSGLPLIVHSGYPRAGFFRTSEWTAANPKTGYSYEAWEAEHAVLGGIYGKVLGEESTATEQKTKDGLTKFDYFNRYKKRFPEKLVLLHFNGNARMPVYAPAPSSPDTGSTICRCAYCPRPGQQRRDDDPGQFRRSLQPCRRKIRTEWNGCLSCANPSGAVDWSHCEQVTVTAIDEARSAITVRRAQYGTAALKFEAGAAFAFPHDTEGPFGAKGKNPPLLWKYNYSLDVHPRRQGAAARRHPLRRTGQSLRRGRKAAALRRSRIRRHQR